MDEPLEHGLVRHGGPAANAVDVEVLRPAAALGLGVDAEEFWVKSWPAAVQMFREASIQRVGLPDLHTHDVGIGVVRVGNVASVYPARTVVASGGSADGVAQEDLGASLEVVANVTCRWSVSQR